MIQEFKTSKGEFLGVLLNNYDEPIYIQGFSEGNKKPYIHVVDTTCRKYRDIELPPSQYKIIGIQTEITKEKAKDIVDESIHTGLFAHYVKDIPVNTYCYKNALESFNSLMQKLEIKPDTKTLIIQKIK